MTYSSVVSRGSVCLAFMVAALNDFAIIAADIGNAYLKAPTYEKVYYIAGKEFGEDEGKVIVIIRAFYGIKSSGAACHSYFASML
jgi:hypothetical protein